MDWKKLHEELTRPGVTRKLLYKEYLATTPDGMSYSRFCENLKNWRKKKKVDFRKDYKAGDSMQIDYAGMTMPIYSSETQEILFEAQIYVNCLCASNLIFTEGTRSQKLECWIGSNRRALEFFGGMPRTGVVDNLKSAVTDACNYDPELNRTFADFAEHYQLVILPARPKKPLNLAAKHEQRIHIEEEMCKPTMQKTIGNKLPWSESETLADRP